MTFDFKQNQSLLKNTIIISIGKRTNGPLTVQRSGTGSYVQSANLTHLYWHKKNEEVWAKGITSSGKRYLRWDGNIWNTSNGGPDIIYLIECDIETIVFYASLNHINIPLQFRK